MSKIAYFVTGTDTEIGKTWCSAALMHYFRGQGRSVAAMKPVASGCHWRDGCLRNDDALILQAQANVALSYDQVNRYRFELPVSPHIAAKQAGQHIDIATIKADAELLQQQADVLVVEGVGGWFAPLTAGQDVSDLAVGLQLPVILVVGIRLGCINHAKLTYRAIQAEGLRCAGWIANCVDPDLLFMAENIATIKEAIDAPLLAEMPYRPSADFSELATRLTITA